jgi:hypothetical protein
VVSSIGHKTVLRVTNSSARLQLRHINTRSVGTVVLNDVKIITPKIIHTVVILTPSHRSTA